MALDEILTRMITVEMLKQDVGEFGGEEEEVGEHDGRGGDAVCGGGEDDIRTTLRI